MQWIAAELLTAATFTPTSLIVQAAKAEGPPPE